MAGIALSATFAGFFFNDAHAATKKSPEFLDNATCLSCHNGKKKLEIADAEGKMRPLTAQHKGKFAKSVHAAMRCVDCHTNITDSKAGHSKNVKEEAPTCIACHTRLWDEAKTNPAGKERLGVVAHNINSYKSSFHARPDTDNPERPKATCHECHDTHEFAVPKAGSPAREQWRLTVPDTCGAKCHTEQLEDYTATVHGKLALGKQDSKGAVCIDCHTSHNIVGTSSAPFKAFGVEACGNCHKENLSSYRDTYHGQVNKLGYVYTARCSDCHGSHGIRKADDPKSKVHPDNRLKTCQKCHNGKPDTGLSLATEGFITFSPHAHAHDFKKYPQMWIATRFMQGLLIFVFAFFWAHSGLWYYREWKDRQARKTVPHVRTEGLIPNQEGSEKHIQRFAVGWRIAHLVFALITMALVLTGTAALYAGSTWAPLVAAAVGGPHNMGLIHRLSAAGFIGVFLIHFVFVMFKLLRNRSFRWFGPDSLIPNWKDLADCWGMFKWFVNKGPKPQFDRWTYFEKFDYWAVFWGVNIIGWSGLMMAFPHVTASYLPGWVFNVGLLVHGEEAFLAAVFLFTVHFFNNHFRPDKLPPPDVVMFTGTLSLDEFRRDHPAQYQRLVATGELEKHLVEKPSRQLHVSSVVLGLALIAAGLALLVLILIGFFGTF